MMDSEQIVYYLRLLNFLRPEEFDNEKLELAERFCNEVDSPISPPLPVASCEPSELVDVVDDAVLRIAVVRDADNITFANNVIHSQKKKYKFDGVYSGDQSEETIDIMIRFLEQRINLRKDSSLLTIGFSRSGKSTLIGNLVSRLCGGTYSLAEIYLNQMYGYFPKGNLKTKVASFDHCVKFNTDDIMSVLEKFAKKSNNGVNERSSRGHVVLRIHYRCGTNVTLFDLAGSEKIKNQDKAEAQYINHSLFNISRSLQNPKHRDGKCVLLELVKASKNIITCFMLTDNIVSKAVTFLQLFASLFK